MKTRTPRRSAFTLVELLVVISIIAILVALTATAVFGIRQNVKKSAAEATLEKIDTKLLQKIKETEARITDDLKKASPENVEVTQVLSVVGQNNKDIAKAILLYARLRRDLPMTYQEANPAMVNRFSVCGYQYAPSPAFSALPNTGGGTVDQSVEESAVCLYAAIVPMGIEGLEQQVATDAAGRKFFTDGMGRPVGFVRLGYDGNNGELNKGPIDPFYPNKNAQTGAYRDLSADYPGGAMAFNNQVWLGVRQPTVPWLPAPGAYRPLTYHTAFCFSAGINEDFDAPAPGLYNGDNLFSYRLRKEGGKGD